jgi:primosomal protein N' (replication factor Y)
VITAQGGTSRIAVTGAHLVVATPGAEPAAEGGYAAAVLLDGDRLLDLASLGAGEDALFRWRAAAALVRGSGEGGVVVLAANSAHRAVEAFLRGDPRGFARLELQERAELRLPPAVAAATVQGSASAVRALAGVAQWPPGTEVLGPVEVPGPQNRPAVAEQQRLVVRIERGRAGELSGALAKAAAVRSARRDGEGTVRIKVNPRDLV